MENKDVVGYEGIYGFENGEIYNLNFRNSGKKRRLRKTKNSNGYLKVELWKDGKGKGLYVHRLVAEAYIPNPNPSLLKYVNHIDYNKENNHPSNLEWVTAEQNKQHSSNLNNTDIIEIRQLQKEGWTHSEIAEKYSYSRSYITQIVNKKRWKNT